MKNKLSDVRNADTCWRCGNCTVIDLCGRGSENRYRCSIRNYREVDSDNTCDEFVRDNATWLSLTDAAKRGIL